MTVSIPSTTPKKIRAGDLVKWKRNFSDFPTSEDWTVKAYLVNSSEQLAITATESGSDYLFTITAAQSAALSAGMMRYIIRAEDDTDIYTAEKGLIEVEADVAAATGGLDFRTFARKALEALEAVIENRASQAHLSLSIAGRSISLMSSTELMEWRNYFKKEVVREERAEGFRRKTHIQIKFTGS